MQEKNLPKHIAIIMDGNGRWAQSRGLPKIVGHQNGAKVTKEIALHANKIGIKYLTIYAFSSENWNRPVEEVENLMNLMQYYISREKDSLNKHGIRLQVIGNREKLSESMNKKINEIIADTQNNTGMNFIIAFSYGAREEISFAARSIAEDCKQGTLSPNDITEELFAKYLYTRDIPDPDLFIRTSGELRVSNFLLWQLAYSELYFTNIYWPDFTVNDLDKAIAEFQKRERRYGR